MLKLVLLFLAGLGTGLGFWANWVRRDARHWQQLVRSLPSPLEGSSLPVWARLSRWIQQQQSDVADLSEQLRIERDILEHSPLGFLRVDARQQLVWYNPQAVRIFHPKLSYQKNESWSLMQESLSLMQFVRSPDLEDLISQVHQQHCLCQADWVVLTVDPKTPASGQDQKPVRGYGFPLADGDVGIFIEDRTEISQLLQDRDRWTSDMAHELKTPLTAIRLVTETLETQVEPTLQLWTKQILQETNRLSAMVQDLLELSRMTNAVVSLTIAPVDLPNLIRMAWLNLEPLAQQRNMSLLYRGPDTFNLSADGARLYRVFLNLLDNALKYGAMDGTILVQVQPDLHQSQVQVDIIDSGSGFPPEALPHVFKRFYRVDTARGRLPASGMNPRQSTMLTTESTPLTESVIGGSGLGLAIVQQILLAHGGQVSAQNHPELGGGWLQVTLPLKH
jgi:two-component system, OmpR family, phosphate regulon sensor histidine kinase PhoR